VAAVAVVSAATPDATAARVSEATRVTRADINRRLGEQCEQMFDELPTIAKVRLRGKTEALFRRLAHGPLEHVEVIADTVVPTTPSDTVLNEPRSYPVDLDASEARPAVV
jgi:hypothetical protein